MGRFEDRIIGVAVGAAIAATMFAASASAARAPSETVLYSFTGYDDGEQPIAPLIIDKSGNLFGTTSYAGAGGAGVVFELSSDGTETVLHTFEVTDGYEPEAGLVEDSQGNFYGTTKFGGSNGTFCFSEGGCGTVFKLAPDGSFTVVYGFSGGSDGGNPVAGLLLDNEGNLYGTTLIGGSTACGLGCGTVFKVAPSGTETVLHAFTGGSDGAQPIAGLIADKKGNLYGTTFNGGSSGPCEPGCGTVFKITESGMLTIIHAFQGGHDGDSPEGALIADTKGNLYGTGTGTRTGSGTVFVVTRKGAVSTLYKFSGGADGFFPRAGLVLDHVGNLDGTTWIGGAHVEGTVFQVTK